LNGCNQCVSFRHAGSQSEIKVEILGQTRSCTGGCEKIEQIVAGRTEGLNFQNTPSSGSGGITGFQAEKSESDIGTQQITSITTGSDGEEGKEFPETSVANSVKNGASKSS
jgi:hypothetical protein